MKVTGIENSQKDTFSIRKCLEVKKTLLMLQKRKAEQEAAEEERLREPELCQAGLQVQSPRVSSVTRVQVSLSLEVRIKIWSVTFRI